MKNWSNKFFIMTTRTLKTKVYLEFSTKDWENDLGLNLAYVRETHLGV